MARTRRRDDLRVSTVNPARSGGERSLPGLPSWLTAVILLLVSVAAALIRLRLADVPLERDEGEYAYAGALMLDGVPPYQLAYNMKLPGTYAAYALIMAVLGETVRGIRGGLVLVNAATILLVWLLGRKLGGGVCGLVAAAVFALLSLSSSVLGLAAHATHFVTLFAAAGAAVFLKAIDSEKLSLLAAAGVLFGLAFLMKQPAVFFGAFAGIVLCVLELRRRPRALRTSAARIAAFGAGTAVPFAITCILLWGAGVFDRFWFWTFSYAREYVALQSLANGWSAFRAAAGSIIAGAPVIWSVVTLGLIAVLLRGSLRLRVFVLASLAATLAAASPGLYFREHYFIPLLVPAALCAGAAVQLIIAAAAHTRWRTAIAAAAIVVLSAGIADALVRQRGLLFQSSPQQVARTLYGSNPFPESLEIGRYVRENSAPHARVAVIGSEPQIYFYSGRRSATGYIYTYGLMEPHGAAERMQREMIAEIEAADPEFLVFVAVPSSWQARPESHTFVFDWFDRISQERYQQVGLVDIRSADETVYRWNEKAIAAIPRSRYYVTVFKRSDLF